MSLPVTPAQPNVLCYPLSDLYLFPEFTTAEQWETANPGQTLPPFVPTNPQKGWADTSPTTLAADPDSDIPYLVMGGSGKTKTIYLSPAVAQVVNLLPAAAFANTGNDTFRSANPLLAAAADANVVTPCPIRPLAANEQPGVPPGTMPLTGQFVYRTDLLAQQQANSGEFLASDRVTLNGLAATVAAIAAKLGVGA